MSVLRIVIEVLGWLERKIFALRDKLQKTDYVRAYRKHLTERQRNCKHLKGGRTRLNTSARDYNVITHTFPNGKTKIWCVLCGAFAWSDGPVAIWTYMKSMAEDSTNHPSSSEIPLGETRGPLVPSEEDFGIEDGTVKLAEDDSPIKGYKASKGWRDDAIRFDGQRFVFMKDEESK